MKYLALVLRSVLVSALPVPTVAAIASPPQITIGDAWIRALPDKLPAGGYFTLHNGTVRTLTLSGASSPACGTLMLHKSENSSGMSSMDDVSGIDVAPGGTLNFVPGGYHLMCMDPTDAIKPGGKVQVLLEFSNGANVRAIFAVRSANGR